MLNPIAGKPAASSFRITDTHAPPPIKTRMYKMSQSQSVAIYARVSSSRQVQQGTIESQLQSLHDFAENQGYAVDPDCVFTDQGISGATLIRPGLDALRDQALAGRIKKVLILCPDRLARKNTHQLILVDEFQRLGVEIVFSNRALSESPEDQLLLQIQGVISEYEREKFRERSRRGRLHKARAGKVNVLVRAPYGYVYVKKTEAQDAKYEIHPEEAKVVRRVFEMYCLEGKSLTQICRLLDDQGIATSKGGTYWQAATLHGMLKNPAYVGRAAACRKQAVARESINKTARERNVYPCRALTSHRFRPESEWITIPVPALIDEELYAKTRRQAEENARFAPRNNRKGRHLLSSLAHCQECGYALYAFTQTRARRDGTHASYYRCLGMDGQKRPEGRVCSQRPIPIDSIDQAFWRQVKRLILSPEVVLKEYTERTEKKGSERLSVESLLSRKDSELRQQEHEKQRLLDIYQHGALTLEEIHGRLTEIRARMEKTQSEKSLLVQEAEEKGRVLQLIEKFESFSQTLTQNLDTLPLEEKRKVIRLLVKGVSVNARERKIAVHHILPLGEKYRLHSARMPYAQSLASDSGLRMEEDDALFKSSIEVKSVERQTATHEAKTKPARKPKA